MTQFEEAVEQAFGGTLRTPDVSYGAKQVDFFTYQLAINRSNLKLMSDGMKFRGIKLKDIKEYYGLKGRTAKDCLVEFEKSATDYKAKYEIRAIGKIESGQLN